MVENQKENRYEIGIPLMVFSAICSSFGQLLWKLSEGAMGWLLFLGFVCYGLGAVFMIVAFSFGELSKLHPLICTSYIIALVLGSVFLGEPITWLKGAAIAFILAGVIFITGAFGHD